MAPPAPQIAQATAIWRFEFIANECVDSVKVVFGEVTPWIEKILSGTIPRIEETHANHVFIGYQRLFEQWFGDSKCFEDHNTYCKKYKDIRNFPIHCGRRQWVFTLIPPTTSPQRLYNPGAKPGNGGDHTSPPSVQQSSPSLINPWRCNSHSGEKIGHETCVKSPALGKGLKPPFIPRVWPP